MLIQISALSELADKCPGWGFISDMMRVNRSVKKGPFVGSYIGEIISFGNLLEEIGNDYDDCFEFHEDFSPFGVCDNPMQFYDDFGEMLKSLEERFVVYFCHIKKDEQPEIDGWRWGKRGPYVGHEKSCADYLYDEEGFANGVYCYHVYEIDDKKEG